MPELSPLAQTWVQVVLIWIGFGSLAGLLARLLLPLREPSSPLATLTIGISGTSIGLGVLSYFQGGGPSNPISLFGFLAATGGALGLLLVYHLLRVTVHREKKQPEVVAPIAVAPTIAQSPIIDLRSEDAGL